MSRLGWVFILSITIVLVSAQRKILSGKDYTLSKGYVVYLLKATKAVKYDAWICGGAIVTKSLIVTSAACVEDVKHMYAIAGYDKYVTYEELNEDDCTREKKKKIIYVCIPSAYTFDYPALEKWANIDIAVAQVESPYDFTDSSYNTHCSYTPSMVEVNYDSKYETPETEAIVYGWGHTEAWRSQSDATDYNVKKLLYGSVVLADKERCKADYDDEKVRTIIDKYMVCSIEEGIFDDQGEQHDRKIDPNTLKTECGPGLEKIGRTCVRSSNPDQIYDYRRNNANSTNNMTNDANFTNYITRRRGICQNDHGGPLITWRGRQEVMIGIASVFRVEQDTNRCIPPFLYTSTTCNGKFLHCLLTELENGNGGDNGNGGYNGNGGNNGNGGDNGNGDDNGNGHDSGSEFELGSASGKKGKGHRSRRFNWESECLKPPKERGFNIIRRTISWIGHPDGPALNERLGVKIQRRENDSTLIQSSHNKKPDTKHVRANEGKTLKVNVAQKKSEDKPVASKGAEESDDDVIKFSDLLKPNIEINRRKEEK